MIYIQPGKTGSMVDVLPQYNNFIGGEWVAPVKGEYFDNISPLNIPMNKFRGMFSE